MKKIVLQISFLLWVAMVAGQTKIIDSAIVVVGYNVIEDRSTENEYLANENFYIWPYEYGKIKKIEKAFDIGNKRGWRYEKWEKELDLKSWLVIIGKKSSTSYEVENYFPEDIRAIMMDFDSSSNLKGKISLDGIQLFSVGDFIKVFKVFVEGVVDTLTTDQVSLISHSNKEGKIVFSQRLDHVKKSGSETTTYSDTAMVTLQINQRIKPLNSIPVFFELRGTVAKDYGYLNVK